MTLLASWRKLKELQTLSYSPGDPTYHLPDGETNHIITGIRVDVTKATRMSMVRCRENVGKCWVNVGNATRKALLFHSLRSGFDCSEIDPVDGSRKAEKAISDVSGRNTHAVTKMALNRP